VERNSVEPARVARACGKSESLRGRMVKEGGIKVAVKTDAHSIAELDIISAGVNQARRAWLSPADVLNAQPLQRMLTLMKR
jgi:DNA polymerase (family 10)